MRRLLRLRTILLVILSLLVAAACDANDTGVEAPPPDAPEWIEDVYPDPGATAAVPDAVSVDHTITDADVNVRLVVDGVDVTTYSTIEAGRLRYESGVGPVVLNSGDHTAEVQLTTLPGFGEKYEVLESYSWKFDTA